MSTLHLTQCAHQRIQFFVLSYTPCSHYRDHSTALSIDYPFFHRICSPLLVKFFPPLFFCNTPLPSRSRIVLFLSVVVNLFRQPHSQTLPSINLYFLQRLFPHSFFSISAPHPLLVRKLRFSLEQFDLRGGPPSPLFAKTSNLFPKLPKALFDATCESPL